MPQARTKVTTKDCTGCRDDFYNGRPEGDCYSLPGAKLAKRRLIPLDMPPPWDRLPVRTLPSCYRRPGYVAVDPKAQ